MPIYEYECTKCGHRFEIKQKFTDDPITDCQECDGQVRKVLFPVGIHFKGSGFYVTDYCKPKGGGESSEETKSGAKS
jgi:putative FmdB family regulatory protein